MKKFFKILSLSVGICLLLLIVFFFLVKELDAKDIKGFTKTNYDESKPVLLPSSFINGERFYLKLSTTKGDTILGYCDTGGGISMMIPYAIDKLNLQPNVNRAIFMGVMPVKYMVFSDVVSDNKIPPPIQLRSRIIRRLFRRVSEPWLLIPPIDEDLKMMSQSMPLDIFFGQNFFMEKSWTIDYIHRQVWVNTPITVSDQDKSNVQKVGFKKNADKVNVYGHPSMTIEVDSEKIDVLFDTGATIVLSEKGKKDLNTTEKSIGGSFIATSIFDKWRKDHPDWKYYEKADHNADIIEVPKVKIGGNEVGPVLFAKRPDENWSKGMIQTMDKVVKGAIGGSGLKYLKVTIDYNSELIKFEK